MERFVDYSESSEEEEPPRALCSPLRSDPDEEGKDCHHRAPGHKESEFRVFVSGAFNSEPTPQPGIPFCAFITSGHSKKHKERNLYKFRSNKMAPAEW